MEIFDRADIKAREEAITKASTVGPWLAFALRAMAVGIFAIGLFYLLGSVIPWEPFKVHHVNSLPERGCTNSGVTVELERTLHEGTITNNRDLTITIESKWRNLKTGRYTPEERLTLSENAGELGPYGRHTIKSLLLREAPPNDGIWVLEMTYVVTGYPLQLRRSYEVEAVSSSTLETHTGPECLKG